jgi:hypothetical protein
MDKKLSDLQKDITNDSEFARAEAQQLNAEAAIAGDDIVSHARRTRRLIRAEKRAMQIIRDSDLELDSKETNRFVVPALNPSAKIVVDPNPGIPGCAAKVVIDSGAPITGFAKLEPSAPPYLNTLIRSNTDMIKSNDELRVVVKKAYITWLVACVLWLAGIGITVAGWLL